jgi:biopolymer transport protein ExbB/TolQ
VEGPVAVASHDLKSSFAELTILTSNIMHLFHFIPLLADAAGQAADAVGQHKPNALSFAFKVATPEGKTTMSALLILSLFSWTIIISKARQIAIARKWTKKFLAAYASTRDPLDIKRKDEDFTGAPAYQLYIRGADELEYHLKNNPVASGELKPINNDPALGHGNTDHYARAKATRVSPASFEAIKVVMEEAAAAEAMSLEKGMIVLSTAVAGGPFIGLLGTVWGVMETFSGIAIAQGASITVMAPGVAGALICTVIGLLVAIPAMFSYNFMVTSIRAITQELDGFTARYANQIEHCYVVNRPLADEMKEANDEMATRIIKALRERAGSRELAGIDV